MINDAQTFGAIAEGVEIVSRLVTRCAIFEATYLGQPVHTPSGAQLKLSEELIVLYTTILNYVLRGIGYYKLSSGERLSRSIVQSGQSMKELLTAIANQEKEVEKITQIIDAERTSISKVDFNLLGKETAQRIESLQKLVQSFERPLVRLAAPLDNLQNHLNSEEQRNLLRWLSEVPYRRDHRGIYNEVLHDMGSWLLKTKNSMTGKRPARRQYFTCMAFPGAEKAH